MAHNLNIQLLVLTFSFIVVFKCSQSHDVARTKILTADNFPTELEKSASFVKFYAPWCSHCVKLAPIWDELAEMLNDDEGSRVQIAEVDCTQESSLCNEQDITGYPTLKFFKKGSLEGIKYRGPRDFPSFSTFINENLADGEEDKDSPEKTSVPPEFYEDVILLSLSKGNHFVMFFAPWCGHSQKLAPVWEELAKNYKGDSTINVEKIDCTVYKNICNHYDIRAYPSLYWLQNGRKVEKYEGHRNIDDFKLFVDDMMKIKESDNFIDSEEKPSTKDGPTKVDESVVVLNSDNFQDEINKGGLLFVKFYAPWCGHSQMLAPVWEELSKSFDNTVIRIAKVDCAVEKQLCNDQNIDGYPTLLLFKGDGKEPIEYEGHRHKEFLREFIALHSHDEL